MDSPSIIIVGAGVLGLSSAVLLQAAEPDVPITLIAAELPVCVTNPSHIRPADRPSPDYASMWAGAHYRPITASTSQLAVEARLALRTEAAMKRLFNEHPEAGIEFMKGVELFEDPPDEYKSLVSGQVYAGNGDDFRVLPPPDLPTGVQWGCEYNTYTVNVLVYCSWLLRKFQSRGGKVIKKTLRCLEEAPGVGGFHESQQVASSLAVVNCSGRNFDTDPKMQFLRGQTVLVKQQYHKTITRQHKDGTWTFLIPRPWGGIVVGGTKEPGDTEAEARMETRADILNRAAAVFPDFVRDPAEFEVVLDNVGRRPWRDGGLRIESSSSREGWTVIHAYGAGGRGYELSWGVAEAVLKLVQQTLGRVPKL